MDVPATTDSLTGFRGPAACHHAKISYRQLDYWDRTGLVSPSVRSARGSGSQRLYSRADVIDLALVKTLLDAGCSLQLVRSMLPEVRHNRTVIGADTQVSFQADCLTMTIDVAALAERIPEPPLDPGPESTPAPATTLHLVP